MRFKAGEFGNAPASDWQPVADNVADGQDWMPVNSNFFAKFARRKQDKEDSAKQQAFEQAQAQQQQQAEMQAKAQSKAEAGALAAQQMQQEEQAQQDRFAEEQKIRADLERKMAGKEKRAIKKSTDGWNNNFEERLALLENGVRHGYSKGKWLPHKSLEGGTDTLAYGHKLTPQEVRSGEIMIGNSLVNWKKGISEEQARALMRQDVRKFRSKLAKQIPEFKSLPEKYRQVLVNIGYNAGSVNPAKWPSLFRHMRNGDDIGVRKEMITTFKEDGKTAILFGRAKEMADAIGLDYDENAWDRERRRRKGKGQDLRE